MTSKNLIPISVIIPTANRRIRLEKTLQSIFNQNYHPREIIIIDASFDEEVMRLSSFSVKEYNGLIIYQKANLKGAAAQRNQGVQISSEPIILFMDDDIDLMPLCIEKMWFFLKSNNEVGGVNSMIINQNYQSPGIITNIMYWVMHGKLLNSYAGKCIGPAWNLLPSDQSDLPEFQLVEWLNTTCTLYKKEALPFPVFSDYFVGYSLMEDLALSLIVGREWKLYNVRTSKIFHDSQTGAHKSSKREISEMELINRFYVMYHIMHRKEIKDYFKLIVFEFFGIFTSGKNIFSIEVWAGKYSGFKKIIKSCDK